MEYSSLEDAWGVQSFETPLPAFNDGNSNRQQWEPQQGAYPVAGPWGYRPATDVTKAPAGVLNPVAAVYMREGTAGVLRLLPAQAVEELKSQLGGNTIHAVAAVLLCGFVLLLMWDVLNRARTVN